jgi:hypothetical protein
VLFEVFQAGIENLFAVHFGAQDVFHVVGVSIGFGKPEIDWCAKSVSR